MSEGMTVARDKDRETLMMILMFQMSPATKEAIDEMVSEVQKMTPTEIAAQLASYKIEVEL